MDLTLEEKLAATVKQLNLADKRIEELVRSEKLILELTERYNALVEKYNRLYASMQVIYFMAQNHVDTN